MKSIPCESALTSPREMVQPALRIIEGQPWYSTSGATVIAAWNRPPETAS